MGERAITQNLIKKCSECYNSDSNNIMLSNAVLRNGLDETALNYSVISKMHFDFSEDIDVGNVTAQNKTGRCWMFASLNTVRYSIMSKLKMKERDFELSENYLFFWDKFEKSNLFLENIIETIDYDIESYEVMHLLSNPMFDNGQWDMFAKLIEKYGIVPKYAMPDTKCSEDSASFNNIMKLKLRLDAKTLRELHLKGKNIEEIENEKEQMLIDIFNIICHFLGEPPKFFDFEYRDENNKFYSDYNITPLEFYHKYSGVKAAEYLSIINYPVSSKPYGKTYSVKFLGSVVDDVPIKYLNMDIDTMKKMAVNQIKDGHQVIFGCDVNKMMHRKSGIMDTELYNYESVLNTKLNMAKGDRIDYRGSTLTHVMTLAGVNLKDGKPNRWKIQNSWGKIDGSRGFFVMSDKWFDEFVLKVVVHRKYAAHEILDAYEKEPVILKPWDPMGSIF